VNNHPERLLLISNSTQHGRDYLDHAESQIRGLLGPRKRVLFVPYALHDRDGYEEIAGRRFAAMGYQLDSIHRAGDPHEAVEGAEALFVGGGNTFRLLKALYDNGLLEPIRKRVEHGMPYIGASAGSVIACPTIRTTNDMPIVEPPSLTALRLIWFQVNCHYLDPDPASTHMGETREERLLQFHEENDWPVVGLREGDMLRIENGTAALNGTKGARIFRRGHPPVEVPPGAGLDTYLASAAAS
jgi:dipeptidase E